MGDLEADIACALLYDLNVLITGENAPGRTSVAHRIHRESRRAASPLVVAGSPGVLDSSDSFVGALLEASPEGTVLLENPERMSPFLQAQLLQFIESAAGSGRLGRLPVPGSYVRFITATSIDLFELVRLRQFHESLFYRLNTIHLLTPSPVRNREGVSALFLSEPASAPLPRLSKATRQRLVAYAWPDNLRELRDVAESLGLLECAPGLEPNRLPHRIRR
jgi:DNA-binding NtrC family response regulator